MLTKLRWPVLLPLLLFLAGCDLVGDIFEFGFWTAVVLIVIVGLIIWAITRLFD